jgi:hypothetical protein
MFAAAVAVSMLAVAACDDSAAVDRDSAQATVQDAVREVRQDSREAWSGLRSDGERLIDRVQARNDPDAKKELLDRCRDAEERLSKLRDSYAGDVNKLCDDIRDADVNNSGIWNEIERRFNQIDSRMRS